MKTRLVLAVIALAGAVAGAAGALAVQDPDVPEASVASEPVERVAAPPAVGGAYLVWTPEVLPAALADLHPAGTERSTAVRGGNLDMVASFTSGGVVVDRSEPGWAFPLDTIGIHPSSFVDFVPPSARAVVDRLAPGHALLGSTSARLRRLDVGGTVELAGGRRLVVDGVIDDALVGAAELVLHINEAAEAGLPPRYRLIASRQSRDELEATVRALILPGVRVRIRAPGETPFLRHGDAVLPQSLVKEKFGEFSYRRVEGRDVEQDTAWQRTNLVTTRLPILGPAVCHRAVLVALRGALRELEERNLAGLLDRGGFAGCWAPRTIQPGTPLSHHAWGIALDVNIGKNPTGVSSIQDPRLVEVMRRWGFASGAEWLVPDPAHFEYLRPPTS